MGKRRKRDYVSETYYGDVKRNMSSIEVMEQELYSLMVSTLTNMAVSRFVWTGLPKTVDARFMELCLINSGLSVFFRDDRAEIGNPFLALPATVSGPINLYHNPTAFTVLGPNYVSRRIDADKCIPIWNNFMRTGDMKIITTYAARLARAEVTQENAMMMLRHPVIVAVTQDEQLSAQNMIRNATMGEPFIFTTPAFSQQALKDKISVLPLQSGDISTIFAAHNQIWNRIMLMLGIQNANVDKRERLITDEVNSNNDQIDQVRASLFAPRVEAAQMMSEIYGLDVRVYWREDYPGMAGEIPALEANNNE